MSFQNRNPQIIDNLALREPQVEAFCELAKYAEEDADEREVGIVLPVGCGKSGCITLAPFAFSSRRVLVVAPGVPIAEQLYSDFDPTNPSMFYMKCNVLTGVPYPEPVEIRGKTTNLADLEEAHVVVTNIQQLQGENNQWLENLPDDYFDLIQFDEGHHSVATTWETLKTKFPSARIVNYSATPLRADGKLMAGKIIYSYPVHRAIQKGYVKRLKAVVLNPTSLKYVRNEDGREVEVTLDEVRRLGEDDSSFRRSIVTSDETLKTIVDASIRELDRIRSETGDVRHKVIASALNFAHCHQIVAAYRARGRKADYVHSRQDAPANAKVLKKLENHELDVIVQVRKLGEGFDHPYLSVAAVCSIFQNLSPFVQFVGRIMRVIKQNSPGHALNQGSVVFHAGANVAQRWEDFQSFSQADQDFFDQLLPVEELEFDDSSEIEVEPVPRVPQRVEVSEQERVLLEEIPLVPEAREALQTLIKLGMTPDDVQQAMKELQPIPTTKVRERQAARARLEQRVQTEVGRLLASHSMNPKGHDLDTKRLGRTNFVVVKSAIDRRIMKLVDKGSGERDKLSRDELSLIDERFSGIVEEVTKEIFDG